MDATLTMTRPGEVIRTFRDARGLTREALARRIDMAAVTIEKYENGSIVKVGPEAARALDDALGAGGEILAACGYSTPEGLSMTVSTLLDRVSDLDHRLRELTEIVEDLRRRGS